jgi:hypothetical protein
VIAVEVFGRKPDHGPAQDSIVPTEASRLRARNQVGQHAVNADHGAYQGQLAAFEHQHLAARASETQDRR